MRRHFLGQILRSKLCWLVACGCLSLLPFEETFAQRGREGGGKGGGGAARGGAQGGGRANAPGGGRAAAQGGGRVNPPGPAAGGARVNAPNPGVTNAPMPRAGGGARANAAPGNVVPSNVAPGGAAATGGARVATPDAGAAIRGSTPGAPAGRAAADARANLGGRVDTDGNLRRDLDGTWLRTEGNATVEGQARTTLRPDFDAADARNRARLNPEGTARTGGDFRPSWSRNTDQAFRSTFGNAWNARAADDRARNANWNNWASRVRNGFYVGPNPYFANNFWNGRNLIGFGLGGYNYGIGGWGSGAGGWWGYSPWVGNRAWNYWYGNPGWNSFAGYYGWQTPYYYDYGPSGNVVYRDNYVYVNDQRVGTADDYAQSAAELAMVTQEQMSGDHDWMPLGTFSVAVNQNESNPARVAQLAYDNKQGLISGTIFNRDSNNLYTLQGKVDPETQRVAFTIGKDPNVVMETGLYNLTQNETPVLVHFGGNKTSTYLFTRLAEPDSQGTQGPEATATAPPAVDLQRQ